MLTIITEGLREALALVFAQVHAAHGSYMLPAPEPIPEINRGIWLHIHGANFGQPHLNWVGMGRNRDGQQLIARFEVFEGEEQLRSLQVSLPMDSMGLELLADVGAIVDLLADSITQQVRLTVAAGPPPALRATGQPS